MNPTLDTDRVNGGRDRGRWSAAKPCPVCEHKDQRCRVSADGGLCLCRYAAEGGRPKQLKNGELAYLHVLREGGGRRLHAGNGHAPRRPRDPSKPLPPRAPEDVLDAVYSAALDTLRLYDWPHRRDLVERRKFSAEAVERNGYRSLGNGRGDALAAALVGRFGAEVLAQVPGFAKGRDGRWTLRCGPGLILPCRLARGGIRGLVCRPDRPPPKGGKYHWISSANAGGPSSGAPVHVPLGAGGPAEVGRVTEGILKADFAFDRTGLPTIALAGVDAWEPALDVIGALGWKTVRLAFDADWQANKDVARALHGFAAALSRAGLVVEVETWDAADGKGIDDLLAGGKEPAIASGDEARAVLEQAARTAGIEPPLPAEEIASRVKAIVESKDPGAAFEDRHLLKSLAHLKGVDSTAFAAHRARLATVRGIRSRDLDEQLAGSAGGGRPPSGGGPGAPEGDDGEGSDAAWTKNIYEVQAGCLGMLITTERGQQRFQLLANFNAEIVEQVIRDDGDSQSKLLVIAGALYDGTPISAEVAADEFVKMDWVVPSFGPRANLEAGRNTKDHVRAAIQGRSHGIRTRTLFTHTGWRRIGGSWLYLSQGGAIGAEGLDESVTVELGPGLKEFRLPAPPEGEELRRAVRASMGLARLGQEGRPSSRALAAVALSLPYRAAIGPTPFGGHFVGVSGSFKSCLAALEQQHFGQGMHHHALPANFDSTANAIQFSLHAAKDAILVVDDFAPVGSRNEVDHIQREADRFVRGQGNRQGRQRLNSDGSMQVARAPRGTLLTTGEDTFRQRSANARTLPITFAAANRKAGTLGTVDPAILTQCQADADAGLYAASMAAFVRWLAPRYEEVTRTLPARVRERRQLANAPGNHARTPEIIAELACGFDVFLAFAVEAGAVSPAEADAYRLKVWDGLMEAGDEAGDDHEDEGSPAELYLRLLVSALNNTKAYLADARTGDVPDGMEARCGWHQELRYVGEGNAIPVWVPGPNTPRIGWTDGNHVFLDPQNAYAAALRAIQVEGKSLPSKRAIHKELDHLKKLAIRDGRRDGRNRFTARVQCEKSPQSVLVLRVADLWPPDDDDPPPGEATI